MDRIKSKFVKNYSVQALEEDCEYWESKYDGDPWNFLYELDQTMVDFEERHLRRKANGGNHERH